jgi:hypothetical protein
VKLVAPKGVDPNITPAAQVMTATEASPLTSAAAWAPAFVTMTLVGYASGNFTNGYLAGFGTNFIQTNNAPTSLRDKKFTVTGWLTGRGSATPAQSLTLISTLDYAAVAAAATDPTDAEKFALSVEKFVAPAANNAVTSNLTLPTLATFATVTWTSNSPSVISNTGVVTRPASGQPDAVVSLSYVITVGTQSTQPVSIEFTVKANEEVVVPVTQDLFFSEYIEGSSNNKAIEIYNPTSTSVDLSQYTISLFTNGATTPTSRTLSGTLNAGDVYVIANSQANAGILAVADLAIAFASGQFGANWNGDDAIGLYKGTTLIDVFGVIGVDPGTSWTVGTGSTVDRTLVRKSSVSTGVTTWNPDQWDVLAVDTVSSLGSHSIS